MTEDEASRRIVAACVDCGSMYAALELSDGTVQPIGSREGCTSCGETEFEPLPQFSGGADPARSDDDD